MMRGVYRRRRLTVPTLVVFGRRDYPWTEEILGRVCRNPERYAERVEFACVDDAAHSSPTTPPPRSPTSRSTGFNEPHEVWLVPRNRSASAVRDRPPE
jgi:pimeloyl-ACP methyl ester carboxylesterase